MDMPSTGSMFHTASQVLGTSSSCISATALVPFSSKTIFLPIGLLHRLDEQVLLAAVDHVLARAREHIEARGSVREQVDGLRAAWSLRSGVSVVDDAQLGRLRSAIGTAAEVARRPVVVEDVAGDRDIREDVLRVDLHLVVEMREHQMPGPD